MSLKNLFGKKLPSLEEEKNKKFKEAKKEDSDELTEDDLNFTNGVMSQEEWEAIQKTKKELEDKDNFKIHR